MYQAWLFFTCRHISYPQSSCPSSLARPASAGSRAARQVVDEFDLRGLFRRRGSIITSLLRNRSLDYKERLTADFVSKMLPSFTDGTLRPVIDRVMDWTDVQNAHRIMGANQNAGKIVLRVG